MASFNWRATAGSPRGGFAARRVAARRGPRNLLDLPGDRIQPLVNVGDVAAFLARHRRPLARKARGNWAGPVRRWWN